MNQQATNWDAKTWFHRFSILSVSLVITTGTAISPALPAMEKTFANYPAWLVDMVATIQQVPAFIVLMISAQLAAKYGIKKMIGIGILLMGLSGIAPALIPNLWFILGSRIIFGIGIGLINSLAITIVNLFYSGDDQAQMLGNRGSFEQIGVCVVNIIVGLLLNISWQVSFLSYFFILIILALFWKVVPDMSDGNVNKKQTQKQRVNLPVILAGIFCGILTTGTVSVMTPAIIVGQKLGSATTASFIITIFTIVGMGMGFLFGTFFKIFRRFVMPLGLLFLSIGAILMNYSTNLIMLTIAIIIASCSYPLSGTYVFNLMGKVAPKNSNALANSILLIGCNVGTAMSPIVIRGLKSVSPLNGAQPGIGLFGSITAILMVVILAYQIVIHPKQSS
ncbi:MFS transporter [Lactobacillaceae bacterium Melli_B3]